MRTTLKPHTKKSTHTLIYSLTHRNFILMDTPLHIIFAFARFCLRSYLRSQRDEFKHFLTLVGKRYYYFVREYDYQYYFFIKVAKLLLFHFVCFKIFKRKLQVSTYFDSGSFSHLHLHFWKALSQIWFLF